MKKLYLGKAVGLLRNKIYRLHQIHNNYITIPLTVEESIILTNIFFRTSQTIQELALATDKNKSVVLRMIDSMEQKGILRRVINPEDRREKILELTDLGLVIAKECIKLRQFDEIFKHLTH